MLDAGMGEWMHVSILRDAQAHARALKDLFAWADRVDLACAWATAREGRAPHWQSLDPDKIRRAVIGVEFAQTEPWVLRALHDGIRLRIGQGDGTFHPKLYLGFKGKRARAIVGSANLTCAAFSSNVELGVLMEGAADEAQFKALSAFHKAQWSAGMRIDEAWLIAYERTYATRPRPPAIPRVKLQITSVDSLRMSWDGYYDVLLKQENRLPFIRVFQDYPSYSVELDRTQAVFHRHARFADASPDERRLLMGLPGASSGLIGSMGPARYAKQLVKHSPGEIGRHLDRIPLAGEVPLSLAGSVVQGLTEIHGVKLGVATRLLAVKRPDLFVSINNGSNPQLAVLLDRKQVTTAKHYVQLLELVWQLDWHRSPPPQDPAQFKAWQRRAALLDSVLYEKVET